MHSYFEASLSSSYCSSMSALRCVFESHSLILRKKNQKQHTQNEIESSLKYTRIEISYSVVKNMPLNQNRFHFASTIVNECSSLLLVLSLLLSLWPQTHSTAMEHVFLHDSVHTYLLFVGSSWMEFLKPTAYSRKCTMHSFMCMN